MATHISAEKRDRQTKRRTIRNTEKQTAVKSMMKKLRALTSGKKTKEAKEMLPTVMHIIHKAASNGAIKKVTASRYVSRLSRLVHSLESTARRS